jgi:glycosyltransferase involved in cell wall biosynthesis
MHGAAVTLAQQFLASGATPDLLLADDMLDVATFLAITRRQTAAIPLALYLHENQLTYPLHPEQGKGPMRHNWGVQERQYPLINWKSMWSADHILFNSAYHRRNWFEALPRFLRHYQEDNEVESIPLLEAKSGVLPVGIDLQRLQPPLAKSGDPRPLILWNQRWEFDKNPGRFFNALYSLQREGFAFRVALCGESGLRPPAEFVQAQEVLGEKVIHFGFAETAVYRQLLWEADIVVSTAKHEFFGISMLEAISAHTFPVLPADLSYPELLPEAYHGRCLYRSTAELLAHLRWALTHPAKAEQVGRELATVAAVYDWQTLAPQYDRQLAELSEYFF